MPEYDSRQFRPPAPVARVVLRTRNHSASISDVPMLIDSGSDVTLLPEACAVSLGLEAEAETDFLLTGFDGSKSQARVMTAELAFEGKTFRGRYLLIEQDYGVLGRNVLNSLRLTLDGPWQTRNLDH